MRRVAGVIGRLAIGSAAIALLAPASVSAQAAPVGRWITQGDQAIFEIAPCGPALCGVLRRVLKPNPGGELTDVHNPDPRLRGRAIAGLPILTGFQLDGDRWKGSIYDLRNGKTYKSFLASRPDGTLALSGCIWLLCQTQTWRPLHR